MTYIVALERKGKWPLFQPRPHYTQTNSITRRLSEGVPAAQTIFFDGEAMHSVASTDEQLPVVLQDLETFVGDYEPNQPVNKLDSRIFTYSRGDGPWTQQGKLKFQGFDPPDGVPIKNAACQLIAVIQYALQENRDMIAVPRRN